ncbi:tannase/feruloyl esterase family alpha/beta hydrolase [Dactylosporangium sp. CA-092794]|uniref:tannase/feruloyl esterase family alpha/beta hydrolase n=1 Tax=Dactylosporangium sp. CA-092794 TaxID=3239929 RepID=UPI003D927830
MTLPGKVVTSATVVDATGAVPAYCDVQLTVVDPASGAPFRVGVFLPLTTWNGRFIGTGGASYSAGGPGAPCDWGVGGGYAPCSLSGGYATASSDAGAGTDGTFVLNADNTLNLPVIDNWGALAIHQTAVTAKQVITAFYGRGPAFSYFQGGSGGGRQAMMEAQRYPHDYDGIAVFWPALNLSRLLPAVLWPEVVMNVEHHFIPQSTFAAVNDRVIAACDGLDGVRDQIVANWQACRFDARTLVPSGLITAQEADIVNKIWQGPRGTDGEFLWYGFAAGTPLDVSAGTITQDGVTTPAPRQDALTWVTHWVLQDPAFDWRTITYESFAGIFEKSVAMWNRSVGAADPDLSAFRAAGGKMIITQGTFDNSIPMQGTIDYYDKVAARMGGMNRVSQFARLFLASGGGHDRLVFTHPHPGLMPAGYVSAVPSSSSALGALVSWVEHAKAPERLLATAQGQGAASGMTRPLCMYPLVARYTGHGSTNDAKNFVCGRSYLGS